MFFDSDRSRDLATATLWTVSLLVLAHQVWRRRRAPTPRGGLASALLVLGLAAGVAELALRVSGAPRVVGQALVGAPLDPRLGWRGLTLDAVPGDTRPRLLAVGDSFTQGFGVAPDETYHAWLARELDLARSVRAGPGWGTLQEWSALEEAWERARPDVVVLQVCSNDFINNDWELERDSWANNNLSARPYWESGRALMRAPARLLAWRRALAERSAMYLDLERRWRRLGLVLERRRWVASTEQHIGRLGRAHAPFERALRTTEEIVARVAERCRGSELVLLPADTFGPYYAEWRALAARRGLPLLTEALDDLEAAERRGVQVRAPDGAHWNAAGHRLVALALARRLRARLRPPPAPRAAR
jgi:lysophospholipase L1-like esterase